MKYALVIVKSSLKLISLQDKQRISKRSPKYCEFEFSTAPYTLDDKFKILC